MYLITAAVLRKLQWVQGLSEGGEIKVNTCSNRR